MKETIFITSCHPLISRNILSTGLLDMLIKENIQVVLIVPQKKVNFFLKSFSQNGLIIEGVDIRLGKRVNLMRYLSLSSLKTKTLYIKRKTEMKGSGLFTANFLSNKIIHSLIRTVERLSYNQNNFDKLFEKYKPYSVFSTDIQSEIDIAMLNEAKKNRIQCVGMVRSWDNLTSKGLIRTVPNKLIVWNNIIKNEAIDLQQIKPSIISVIGIPHYDNYKTYDYSDKEGYFNKIGADINKKIALFIPIGDRYLKENNVDRDVITALDKILPDDYQILVRFPPGDHVRELENKKLENLKHDIVYDRSYLDLGSIKMTELRREDDLHLGKTLFWSDLVVSGPSTLVIDSVYMNKPVVLFAFDGYKLKKYFDSIKRYYDYNNFVPIVESDGVRLAYSVEEFNKQVMRYIDNPRTDEVSRANLAKMVVVYLDGGSTVRLFNIIKK